MANALEAASLVMIPSGYENGTLGSLKPLDGTGDFTFSRGSDISATRVNEDGYIEKGYENLLLQSNQFDTTWTNIRSSETGGQPDKDGGSTAWLLGSTDASTSYIQQNISSSGVQTFSVIAHKGTTDFIYLLAFGSNLAGQYFDLNNGTLAAPVYTTIDASIEDLGGGWYRCSLLFESNVTHLTIFPADSGTSSLSAVGSNIYIQDAMLNQGLVAYPYVETTTAPVAGGILEDMPRLDYSGSCPALLLEPQRTNLIPYSEYYEGSGYLLESNATLDSELYESPEGVNNAYKLNLPNTLSRITHAAQYSGVHSFSVWMKADTSGTITLRCATGNPAVSEQKNVTTEWQRFDITATDGNFWQVLKNGVDTLSSVYIYGHEIEAGSYPTSYIPTYGTSQTRLRDETDNLSSPAVAGATEFTWFFDNTGSELDGAVKVVFQLVCTGTPLRYYSSQGGRFYAGGYFGEDNAIGKLCVKYNGTTLTMFKDGVKSTSTINTNLGTTIYLDRLFTTDSIGAPIRLNQMSFFPTALSDDECIELTTI